MPSPKSIYKNIFKLPPGIILKINKDNLSKITNHNRNNYENSKFINGGMLKKYLILSQMIYIQMKKMLSMIQKNY